MIIRLFLVPGKFGKFGKFDSGAARFAADDAPPEGWASAAVHVARAWRISAAISLTMITAWWLLGAVAGTSAQSSPEAVPAEECIVAPRTGQEIAVLLADPYPATPAATTAGQTLPAGEPVTDVMPV